MTIGVIAVSSRQGAFSLKVANNLAGRLKAADSFVVDLHRLVLPLSGHQLSDQVAEDLKETRQKLQQGLRVCCRCSRMERGSRSGLG